MISIGLLIMSFSQAHIYKYIYLYIYFPGTQSPIHHTNFMYALDDSLDTFMHQTKKWKLIKEEKRQQQQMTTTTTAMHQAKK